MTDKCKAVKNAFFDKFGYFSEVPSEVVMEEPEACEKFCEVLKRSIETGVDETIEEYGTDPTFGKMPFDGVYIN